MASMFFSIALGACRSAPPQTSAPAPPPAGSCAQCAAARLTNLWCEACNVGYVAGVRFDSRMLFEAVDAHGHDLVLSTISCPTCKAEMERDGFCDTCRRGWIRKQAYYSRLTYRLAQGRALDPAAISCPACRQNATRYGWCGRCGVGMVGNVAISDRAAFDDGCRGFELMLAAIDASRRCKTCALAVLNDAKCFACGLTYRAGRRVDQPGT